MAPDNSWEGQEGGAGVGEVTPILYGGRVLHSGFLFAIFFVFTFLSDPGKSIEGVGHGCWGSNSNIMQGVLY